jgi:hypothetical protein
VKIVVHIDRILLDGVATKFDRQRLSSTIERELSRFLKAAPLERWRNDAIGDVAAPVAPISATKAPEAIGRGIARATGSVLTRSQATNPEQAFGGTTGAPA